MHVLATGKYLMTAMLLIPFRHRRILVHILNNIAPANSRVVGTEGDFTFLCTVRNDAHFSAPEVVVKQVLEPHACDKEEVPTIRTSLFNIGLASIATDFPVVLTSQAKRLVELFKQFVKRKL